MHFLRRTLSFDSQSTSKGYTPLARFSLQRITPEAYNLNEVMIDSPGQEEEGEEVKRSPCLQTLYKLHLRMFKPKKVELNTTEKVLELLQPVRYKPTSVAEMAEEMRERTVADHFYCNSGLTKQNIYLMVSPRGKYNILFESSRILTNLIQTYRKFGKCN